MRGLIDAVVTTTVPGSERTSSPRRAAEAFRALGVTVHEVDDCGAALDRAMGLCGGRTLLVTGSLYLVGEARRRLLGDTK
jgi:folylpolyglutamate synthase/dihydropteroate synthase